MVTAHPFTLLADTLLLHNTTRHPPSASNGDCTTRNELDASLLPQSMAVSWSINRV